MRLHHWRNAGLSSLMPSPITAVRRPPIAMRRRLVSMWRAVLGTVARDAPARRRERRVDEERRRHYLRRVEVVEELGVEARRRQTHQLEERRAARADLVGEYLSAHGLRPDDERARARARIHHQVAGAGVEYPGGDEGERG